MEEEFDYAEIVKQALIPGFYADSQVGRSMADKDEESRADFKRKVFASIMALVRKADEGILANADIRAEIQKLADMADVSVGQAQKVINVYLKYYCILKWGNDAAKIGELDCPIDSVVVEKVWERLPDEEREKFRAGRYKLPPKGFFLSCGKLKNIDLPFYQYLQAVLESIGHGVRVRADIELYDNQVIRDFLSSPSVGEPGKLNPENAE